MNIERDPCKYIAQARRKKGVTQSELAQNVSCKQSAISMFERGNPNALSSEKQQAIAKLLDIAWPPLDDIASESPSTLAFCPNFDCPANYPYRVANQLLFMPYLAHDSNSTNCKYCGEVLEKACPNCKTHFQSGACCQVCGTAYISIPEPTNAEHNENWLQMQRKIIQELKAR
jgi:transcriptional regulator with XRE-family HTH domain